MDTNKRRALRGGKMSQPEVISYSKLVKSGFTRYTKSVAFNMDRNGWQHEMEFDVRGGETPRQATIIFLDACKLKEGRFCYRPYRDTWDCRCVEVYRYIGKASAEQDDCGVGE